MQYQGTVYAVPCRVPYEVPGYRMQYAVPEYHMHCHAGYRMKYRGIPYAVCSTRVSYAVPGYRMQYQGIICSARVCRMKYQGTICSTIAVPTKREIRIWIRIKMLCIRKLMPTHIQIYSHGLCREVCWGAGVSLHNSPTASKSPREHPPPPSADSASGRRSGPPYSPRTGGELCRRRAQRLARRGATPLALPLLPGQPSPPPPEACMGGGAVKK